MRKTGRIMVRLALGLLSAGPLFLEGALALPMVHAAAAEELPMMEDLSDDDAAIAGGYIEMPWDIDAPAANDSLTWEETLSGIVEEKPEEGVWIPDDDRYVQEPATIQSRFPDYDTEEKILNYLKDTYPATRRQNPYGSCWAHSAVALTEFYMIRHGLKDSNNAVVDKNVNYSELQLAYFCYHQSPNLLLDTGDTMQFKNGPENFLNFGGNLGFASQSLMRYNGVAAEMDGSTAYSNAENVLEKGLDDQYAHGNNEALLKNEYQINLKENPRLAKQAILENGIIGASFYWDSQYLAEDGKSFFNGQENKTNHAVAIVGWDDNYPATSFKTSPGENGAWLIRNSWSTDPAISSDSYFWISYKDTSLLSRTAYVFEFADRANGEVYDNNYYYDSQLHNVRFAPSSRVANVFTAQKPSEELKAVSLDFTVGDRAPGDYTIRVYKDLTNAANPESGVLVDTMTGTLPFAGRYTIPLSASAENRVLTQGETFSVVVETGDSVYVDRECDFTWKNQIEMNTHIGSGESFYYYDQRWVDLTGNSSDDSWGNVCIRALTNTKGSVLPEHVVSLSATGITSDSVTLTWSAAQGATDYQVLRSNTKDGTYELISTVTGGVRKYVDTGLDGATDYYYKVYPVINGEASEAKASPVCAVRTRIAAPEILITDIGGYTAMASWNQVSGCDGYEVRWYKAGSSSYTYSQYSGAETTNARIRNLTPQTGYTIKVVPYTKNDGNLVYSENVGTAGFTTVNGNPVAVKNLRARPDTGNYVELTWDELNDVAFFIIEQSEDDGVNYTTLRQKYPYNKTVFYPGSLNNAKKYTFRVTAVYTYTVENGTVTPIISASADPVSSYSKLSEVSNLGVSASFEDKSITVTWTGVANANYYAVYRRQSSETEFMPLATVAAAEEMSYKDRSIIPGKRYYYRVYGCRENVLTDEQGICYHGYGTLVHLDKVTEVSVAPRAMKADLTWEAVTGADKYEIQKSDGGMLWSDYATVPGTQTAYTFTGLEAGTTYNFRIRAVSDDGGVSVQVFNGTLYDAYTPFSYTTTEDDRTALETTDFSFSASDAVYDGQAHAASVTTDIAEVTGAGITLTYAPVTNDTAGSFGSTVPVDVGTWQVMLSVPQTDDYRAAALTSTDWRYTISPASLTIKAKDNAIIYGDSPSANGVDYTGFVNSETSEVLTGTLSYDFNYQRFGDVGTYTITPKGLTGSNYSIEFATGTLSVNAKEVTVSGITASDKEYDKTVTASLNCAGAMITGRVNGDSVTVSATGRFADENAGEGKTVTLSNLTLGGSKAGNYVLKESDSQKTATASIAPRPVSVTWTGLNKEYNGEAQKPAASLVESLLEGDVCTVDVSMPAGHTDVGNYTATAVLSNGNYQLSSATAAFHITKKALTVSSAAATGRVYNGNSSVAVTAVNLSGAAASDDVDVEMTALTGTLAGVAAGSYNSITLPSLALTGTRAGNYSLTQPAGAVALSAPVEITKAPVTVRANNKTKVYGAADPALTATVSGMVNGESTSLISYSLSRESGENYGNYSITPSGDAEQGNYSVTYVTGTFSITKTAAGMVAPTVKSLTYTGVEQELVEAGSATGGTLYYAVTEAGEAQPAESAFTEAIPVKINAGRYTVWYMSVGDGNHENSAVNSVDVTIAKKAPVLTVNMTGWTYGGTKNAPEVSGNAGNGSVTWKYKKKNAADSTYTTLIPEDAGTYLAQATVAETANYLSGTKTGEFSIAKTSISPVVSIADWTYGGTASTPQVSGNPENGAVTCRFKLQGADDSTYTAVVPTTVGGFTIEVTVAETDNHLGGRATTDFAIGNAVLTGVSVAQAGALTYNGDFQTPVVSRSAMAKGGQTIAFTFSETQTGTYTAQLPTFKDAGENTVYYKVSAPCHDTKEGSFKVTINKARFDVSVTGNNQSNSYDGTLHTVSGYSAASSSSLYDSSKVTFQESASASRTDAGTTYMGLTAGQFRYSDVNCEVSFSITDGFQTITPVPLTVTVNGNQETFSYDGEAHSATGYSIDAGSTDYGENDFAFSGTAAASRTDVGTTVMGLCAAQFTNTSQNYDPVTFEVSDGFVKVTKAVPTASLFAFPVMTGLSAAGNTGTPYTGSPIVVTAPTAKSGVDGIGTVTVYYQKEGSTARTTQAPVSAGKYAVTFDVMSGTNYDAAEELGIGILKINKNVFNGTDAVTRTELSDTAVARRVGRLPEIPDGAAFSTPVLTENIGGFIVPSSLNVEYVDNDSTFVGWALIYSTTSVPAETVSIVSIPVTGADNYEDYTITVTIIAKDKEDAGVSITGGNRTVIYGDPAFTLTTTVQKPGDPLDQTKMLKWTSDVPSVASIDESSGTVTIVGQGMTTIKADYESGSTMGHDAITLTVRKKVVTITGLTVADRVYDGTAFAEVKGTPTVNGLSGNDSVSVVSGNASFADKTADTNKEVIFTGYSLAGTKAGNYSLSAQPTAVATITKKPVTATVTATGRVYESGNRTVTLVAGTVADKLGNDDVRVDVSQATGTLESDAAGADRQVTVRGVRLSGEDAANYELTGQPEGVTVTIAKTPSVSVQAPDAGGFTVTPESIRGKGDGRISGVSENMEYRYSEAANAVNTDSWISCTGTVIQSVRAGVYEIRFKETAVAEASQSCTVTVAAGDTASISGTVTLSGEGTLGEVHLTAMDESGASIPVVYHEDHTYTISDLSYGFYSIVATHLLGSGTSKTTTILVETTVKTMTGKNIEVLGAGKNESSLTADVSAAGLATVLVGGLNEEASKLKDDDNSTMAEDARLEMIITSGGTEVSIGETDSNNKDDILARAKNAYNDQTGEKTHASFMDVLLQKKLANSDIAQQMTLTDTVLEMIIPFRFSGKYDVRIWRSHAEDQVQIKELKRLLARPAAPFTEGTYFLDYDNDRVYVFGRKFSTYAVTYTDEMRYTVVFDSAGGTMKDSQSVAAGGLVENPGDPTKDNHDFEGWYLGTVKWDFSTGLVNSDLTLTAKWKKKESGTPSGGGNTPGGGGSGGSGGGGGGGGTVAPVDTAEMPLASVPAGTYDTVQTVTLSTATEGAQIYYTTDGSEPSASSTLYSEAINVDRSMTVKAVAVKGTAVSTVAEFAYVLQAQTPAATPAAGIFEEAQSIVLSTNTEGAEIYYTTDGSTPSMDSSKYSEAISVFLKEGEEKTAWQIRAIAVKSGWENSAELDGTWTIKAKPADEPVEPEKPDKPDKPDEPEGPEKPVDDEELLADIGGSQNLKELENAVVETISSGDGGTTTVSKLWIGGLKASYTYTGSAIRPEIRVYDGLKKLTVKSDYSVSYANNKNVGVDTAKITVRFKGNYQKTDPQTVSFTISPARLDDEAVFTAADLAVIAKSSDRAQKPIPVVYWVQTGKVLQKSCYTVSYRRSGSAQEEQSVTTPGEYTAVIKGKTPNFDGTAEVKVTVLNSAEKTRNLANAKIEIETSAKTKLWTGAPVEFKASEFKVRDASGTEIDDGKYTLSYLNNIAPGKATVVVIAADSTEDGYVGSRTATFTIRKGKNGDSIDTLMAEEAVYVKGGVKPEVTVTDVIDGRKLKLKAGTDYTVSYQKNTAATVAVVDGKPAEVKEADKTAVATIKGKGNYRFTITKKFAILPQDLSKLTLTVEDRTEPKGATGYKKPKVTFADANGKKLAASDYQITSYLVDGGEIAETPRIGTLISVRFAPGARTKNYYGIAEGQYRIISREQDISKTRLARSLPAKAFTGSPVELALSELDNLLYFGNDKSKTLKAGTDFDVLFYSGNAKKGTAKVTLAGIMHTDAEGVEIVYGGTKTVTFKITQKKGSYQGALVNGVWKIN